MSNWRITKNFNGTNDYGQHISKQLLEILSLCYVLNSFQHPYRVIYSQLKKFNFQKTVSSYNKYVSPDRDGNIRLMIVNNLHLFKKVLLQLSHCSARLQENKQKQIKYRESINRILLQKNTQYYGVKKDQNFIFSLKNAIIPIFISFLKCNQLRCTFKVNQIKQAAGQKLGPIIHKLSDKDRVDFVLGHVIQKAHNCSNDDNRLFSFSVKLEIVLGGSYVLSFWFLGDDFSAKVRKQAINHYLTFRSWFQTSFSQINFYEIVRDAEILAIRKACVDIIIQIAELSSDADKENSHPKSC